MHTDNNLEASLLCSSALNPALFLPWQEFGAGEPDPKIKEASIFPPRGEEQYSEESAIRSAGQGDRDAFEWLVRRHLGFISREISKHCPASDLQDVAQETLIRVYQALPAYHHADSFLWWLKKITTRACLDYWRKTRRAQRT